MEMLLRRHGERWFRLCRGLMGNDADAQDAAQNGSVAVVKGLDRFDGQSQFSTWSFRVVTNACLDDLRRRSRFTTRHDLIGDDPYGRMDQAQLPTTVGHDHSASVVDQIVMGDALRSLSGNYRAAVVLRDICDLDYAEIATVLDIPPGTVRSRIARGRAALASTISGNHDPLSQRPTAE